MLLPVRRTHHSDTDSVLILLREDAHHGRGQKQQDQGVLKLKNESRRGGFLSVLAQSSPGFLGCSRVCGAVPHGQASKPTSSNPRAGGERPPPFNGPPLPEVPHRLFTDIGFLGATQQTGDGTNGESTPHATVPLWPGTIGLFLARGPPSEPTATGGQAARGLLKTW